MWIRKSDEQIEKEKIPLKSLKTPLGIGFAILFFIITNSFLTSDGRTGIIYLTSINSWEELLKITSISFIAGIVIWICMLISKTEKISSKNDKDKTMVCLSCNKKRPNDNILNCECGGITEYIENCKWVDE